jgi:hypothetical protein
VISQALGGVGVSTGIAVSALLAEDILGSPDLAGLASTTQVLGAAAAAYLIATLSTRADDVPAWSSATSWAPPERWSRPSQRPWHRSRCC